MATSNLDGPFDLTYEGIAGALDGRAPGVFALGYRGEENVFYINYIGRSDSDLRSRLMELIGSDRAFKYRTETSGKEAFIRECELFHGFRPPSNHIHPARPVKSDWKCPRCSMLGW